MVQSGAAITITLGAVISGSAKADGATTTMTWTTGVVAGATDRAGNPLVGSAAVEPGTADHEF